jgi:hypothetical protein
VREYERPSFAMYKTRKNCSLSLSSTFLDMPHCEHAGGKHSLNLHCVLLNYVNEIYCIAQLDVSSAALVRYVFLI